MTTTQPDAAISDLATDYLDLDSLFTAEELAQRDKVRAFVDARIRPNIARWYEDAHFPREIATEFGDLGLLGMHLTGYGCPGRSAVEYGLTALELEAGDSGLRTFVSVQGSLAMSAIHKHGSEEQKQQWLPGMAKGELIGCFGLDGTDRGQRPGWHDDLRPAGRVGLGADRCEAVDRVGVDRRHCGDLGADRRGDQGFRRPDRHCGVHRDPYRAEAVDAGLHPVRHHPG